MTIRLENVWYRYPGSKNWALRSINIAFSEHKTYSIVGPNGSGKTTLLKIAALLYKPTKGHVRAWGANYWELPPSKAVQLRRNIVYVHEKPVLLRGTVTYNIAYGLMIRGYARVEAEEKARRMLGRLELTYLADKKAKQLSMGEAQLTAILRAVILEPRMLALDEPLAHLDRSKREKILKLLVELKETGTGIIIATHNQYITQTLTEKTIHIENGEIVQVN